MWVWLVPLLIVANIPVYLLIGWIVFDTKEKAGATLLETIVAMAKIIALPAPVRMILGYDDGDAIGLLPILVFLFACGFLVWGEYLLINWMLGGVF